MAKTIDAIVNASKTENIDDFCDQVAHVVISCNWIATDNLGQIAYQQSGRAPKRKGSGLMALEAWEKENLWDGFLPKDQLVSIKNPKEGYLCSANNNIPHGDKPMTINLSMGPYRFERISNVLSKTNDADMTSMQALQNDLFSLQADKFLAIFENQFPSHPLAQVLQKWDRCYATDSIAATLFERFYRNLLVEAFSDNFFNEQTVQYLFKETSIVPDYYHLFDNILLSQDDKTLELWFGSAQKRLDIFQKCLKKTLSQSNSYQLPSWGEVNSLSMKNIFFQGKLPKFLGFDYGPFALPGGRATIVQGGIHRIHGLDTSFAPSWRMIADLDEDFIHTALAGGASDRRFDSTYKSGITNWLAGKYKRIHLKA